MRFSPRLNDRSYTPVNQSTHEIIASFLVEEGRVARMGGRRLNLMPPPIGLRGRGSN